MTMSKNTWTQEQEAAIRTRGCNLLVSAAAGAGKTAVLVERIVRRILDEKDPVDVDKLLVVTFTNAAAREMRERIGEALTQRLRKNPHDQRLQRQKLLLGKAAISTLHSFCLEIIRQNYYHLQLPDDLVLDPCFRIADDIEGILLKMEILEELFEEKYREEEAVFLALVEGMGGERNDQTLQDLVLKLYHFSRSQVDPIAWLGNVAQVFQANLTDEAVQSLFRRLLDSIVISVREALDLLQEAYRFSLQPGGPAVYSANLELERQELEEVLALSSCHWQAAFAALAEFKFSSLKACRGEVDESLKEAVQALRNQAKEIVRNLQKDYLSRNPAELVADMQQMAPLMECLCSLVQEFSLRYLREKLARNLIDFDDLEHFALRLLGQRTQEGWWPSKLAEGLRKRFEEVLVDEYQDINAVQEAVLTLVSRSGDSAGVPNLFMVGDVKQSIYGFRLAEPGLFLKKYRSYAMNATSPKQKIILAKNFRSRKNVVEGVNFVFRQLMSNCLGGISYDQENELVLGACFPEFGREMIVNADNSMVVDSVANTPLGNAGTIFGDKKMTTEWPLEVHIIDRKAGEDNNFPEDEAENQGIEAEENPDALQMEARLIGRRILELQKEMVVWDKEKKKYRVPEFSDMVVLLRSVKGSATTFLEEFRKLGIPVYVETGSGYFAAQEVQVMLSLLKVIDNPCQDIPLAAVLLSPVVGLTAEQLARIRLNLTATDFYTVVCLAARREEEPLKSSLRFFLKKLKSWRTFARRNSLVELIWLLYRETGFYDYAGAMPGGKQRQANLRALLDRAKQFEDTTMKGLFKFLRFLGRLKNSGSDLGTARALGEKENVVRIMSIHKSKGLEFPVVFLACLGKMFNLQELRGDVLLDRDLGLGPMWVDSLRRLKYPTLAKLVVRDKLKEEMLAEEVRILYVAMTRAREALIMVGSVKDLEKQVKRWGKVLSCQGWELPATILTQSRSPWDWLGPCLLRHRGGHVLREVAGYAESAWEGTENDPAPWHIYLWNTGSISADEGKDSYDHSSELACVKQLLPVDKVKNEESNSKDKDSKDKDSKDKDSKDKDSKDKDNKDKNGKKNERSQDKESQDEAWSEEIDRKLGWNYIYRGLADIPAKLSVTEIKNRYQFLTGAREISQQPLSLRSFERRPRFLQEQALSASEKGTILHLVMRYLKLDSAGTVEEVKMQIAEMVKKEIITSLQAETVKSEEIVNFINSSLGKRMRIGRELKREVPFTLALPAGEFYPEVTNIADEMIILQGTIDCLFKEGEEFVLVDYKTDRLEFGTGDILRERYRVQMALYARAVETIFARPVKEKLLYSFYLREAILM
jgi:ATP-dependent helicase/nuclease subunit A